MAFCFSGDRNTESPWIYRSSIIGRYNPTPAVLHYPATGNSVVLRCISAGQYRRRSRSRGGFNNQPQQLMFGSGFGEFHIVQEFAVNLYR